MLGLHFHHSRQHTRVVTLRTVRMHGQRATELSPRQERVQMMHEHHLHTRRGHATFDGNAPLSANPSCPMRCEQVVRIERPDNVKHRLCVRHNRRCHMWRLVQLAQGELKQFGNVSPRQCQRLQGHST